MCSTVLVFDSGVGGLSVYNEICKLLPNLHYLYVFDNIVFPYGEKSAEITTQRVVSIISAVTRLHALALVVIACNSASIVSLPALRARFIFPVVGVVPAIKPATYLTRNGVIGLLATRGTLQRSYTHDLIARFAKPCKITLLGSKELVELAERKLRGHLVSIRIVRAILQPWLNMSQPPDTIILGCTHFPLIRDELTQVLPAGTQFIDSGAAIARRVVSVLGHPLHTEIPVAQNMALCMDLTQQAKELIPILKYYGFRRLEQLKL
ncbi:glutamate racemase [Candidatus Erwinia haradaeae]|uniref:Glutamate racemase n=1 Tax=Candidatus Erwinia haradaeae TaxID=1922217 RepID=A0A451DAI7_9GAMM|nr:glutamate racemase [Candidatus Erwinia haradaeae]VFP83342.1 Glutamate racemase [Candidatus Erwinia haradaeae]